MWFVEFVPGIRNEFLYSISVIRTDGRNMNCPHLHAMWIVYTLRNE